MIERGELRLPEMQRRYVWRSPRVCDLLDSPYRGYPSGAILLWETDEAVPLQEFALAQQGNPNERRAEWKGSVTVPKGGRSRRVPMTSRLAVAFRAHRNLRGRRVLTRKDGRSLTQKIVQLLVRAARKAARRRTYKTGESMCFVRRFLFAPRDARSTNAGDSGTRWTQRHHDDATLHAPESRSSRQRDPVA